MPGDDMDDFQKVRDLVRLKRFETPPEGFAEDLLARLHERQRAEMLKQSPFGFFWEQAKFHWDQLFGPRLAWVPVAAAVVLAFSTALFYVPAAGGKKQVLGRAKSIKISPDKPGSPATAFSVSSVDLNGIKSAPIPGPSGEDLQTFQLVITTDDESEYTIAVPSSALSPRQ